MGIHDNLSSGITFVKKREVCKWKFLLLKHRDCA